MAVMRTEEEFKKLYEQYLDYFFERNGKFPSANYVRLKKVVFSLFFRKGFRAEDAEDAWQETFRDLENGALRSYYFNSINSVQDRNLENFLIGIAFKNKANILTGRARDERIILRKIRSGKELEYSESSDRRLYLRESMSLTLEAIGKLSDILSMPLLLRLDGKSYDEITSSLGISYGAARVRISEAKKKVRERVLRGRKDFFEGL